MSKLGDCVKRYAKGDAGILSDLESKTAEHKSDKVSVRDANRAAIEEVLNELYAERGDIVKQVVKQLGERKEEEQTPETPSPVASKIEDFGEKISGAKKEYAASYKDKLNEANDVDIIAESLSKSWPEPDYEKLLESGQDSYAVATVRSLRDEIPNKPGSAWKQKRWAEQVKFLRDTATKLMNSASFLQLYKDEIKQKAHIVVDDAINGRAELYQMMGHGKSLKGIRITRAEYSVYNGVAQKPAKIIWQVERTAKATAFSSMPYTIASGATRQEALDNFKKAYASLDTQKDAAKGVKFDLYYQGKDRTNVTIGKKVGRNYIDLKSGFKNAQEARIYRAEHQEELVALLEKKKEIPKERYDVNQPRVGQDMRNAQDVTPEMFQEAFGFRGVQFGNYVEGKRRQSDLNNAYDALMDMAAVLGIPPKSLSLNGELGLAFGARGSGGKDAPSAHYEPNQIVINLTKREGAGSLAHEWWHAVSNYFARMRGEKNKHISEALDVSLAARGSNFVGKEGVRREMIEAFGAVVKAINSTGMRERSSSLDARRTKEYWGAGDEMAARAFERYIIAKLQDQSASNDYLANVVSQEYWDAADALGVGEGGSYPYPTVSELPEIRGGFDKLFQTIESKQTDKGVALYSKGEGTTTSTPETVTAAIAAKLGKSRTAALLESNLFIVSPKLSDRLLSGFTPDFSNIETSVAKRALNGLRADIEFLSGITQRIALGDVTYSSLDAETKGLVLHGMERSLYNFKVLDPVIGLDAVNVMDAFVSSEGSPEKLLHNMSMLSSRPAIFANHPVSGLVDKSSGGAASVRAKTGDSNLTSINSKFFSATGTGNKSGTVFTHTRNTTKDSTLDSALASLEGLSAFLASNENNAIGSAATGYGAEVKDTPLKERAPFSEGFPTRFTGNTGSFEVNLAGMGTEKISVLRDSGGGDFEWIAAGSASDIDRHGVTSVEKEYSSDTPYNNTGRTKIQGFTIQHGSTTRAFLVEGNIDAGNEYNVLLHEITHMTRLNIRKEKAWSRVLESVLLQSKIKGHFFNEALKTVPENTPKEDIAEEILSYAIERNRTDIGVVRRVIAMIKKALVEMGISPLILNANDFKALSINAVRSEASNQASGIQYSKRSVKDDNFQGAGSQTETGDNEIPGDSDTSTKGDRGGKSQNAYSSRPPSFNASTPTTQELPAETKFQAALRKFQDKYNRVRVLEDFVGVQGVSLSEKAKVSRKLATMNGKVADQLKRFLDQTIAPLIARAGKLKVSVADLADYLLMQHVEEANRQIQKKTGKPDKLAYGISDDEAEAALQEYQQRADFTQFKALAEDFRKLSEETADMLVAEGILPQEMRDRWNAAYDLYVPVRGDGSKPSTAKGLRVSGKQRGRHGHERRNENVIENIVKMREFAIKEVEKNKVVASIAQFLVEANDDRIGTISKPKARPVYKAESLFVVQYKGSPLAVFPTQEEADRYMQRDSRVSGQKISDYDVSGTADPFAVWMVSPVLKDNEVNFYLDGKQVRLTINDEVAANALTNLGTEGLGTLLSVGKTINNYFSRAYTGYDPRFTIRNTFRDFTAGMINLAGDYGTGMAIKIAANYPSAVREFIRSRNDPSKSQWVDRYRKQGGSTGASWLPSIEKLGEDIEAMWHEQIGAIATYNEVFKQAKDNGSSTMAARAKALAKSGVAGFHKIPILGHFLQLIEMMNAVSENAFRVAVFKTLVENGKTEAEAGEAAKNSTINFDKRGEMGAQMGALWLFFNPAVQGIHRTGTALFKSKHKYQAQALVGSMALVGFMAAEMGMMMGGDDEEEWQKVPRNVKSRNLVISLGGGKQITIPLPYEYGAFVGIGTAMNAWAHGKADHRTALDVAGAIIDGLSPLGNPVTDEGNIQPLNMMPTMVKVLLAPTMNMNNFGNPIAPKKYDEHKPDSQNMWRGTKGSFYDTVATGLNAATGGNKYESGVVDVSPEVLKFYTRTILGGAATFVDQVVGLGVIAANGAQPDVAEIPMVSVLVRENTVRDSRREFWDIANRATQAVSAYKMAVKNRDPQAAAEIKIENGPLMQVAKIVETQAKLAKAKRDAIDAIRLNDNMSFAEKRDKTKRIEAEEERIYDKLLKKFNAIN